MVASTGVGCNTFCMTDRARYVLAPKELSTGQPWILAESCEVALPVFELGTFGFELTHSGGSSFEDAHTVAMYLIEHITDLRYAPPD